MLKIPDKLLKIRDACRHFACQRLQRHNLNTYINHTLVVKNRHFGTDVVDHESIFAKLNFNADPVFDEIHLTECATQ